MDSNEIYYRSPCYGIDYLSSYLKSQVSVISNMIPIPHTVPISNNKDAVISEVRKLFNIVAISNIEEIKRDLRTNLISHLTRIAQEDVTEEMNEISLEILNNFIVFDTNIKINISMLNSIYNLAPSNKDRNTGVMIESKPIAFYFVNNCREMFFKLISEENIQKLASLDQDDEDQLDIYTKEKNKIFNLISTMCALFDQRNNAKSIFLPLGSIYGSFNTLLQKYYGLTAKMNELGDPYDDTVECTDPDTYDLLNAMRSIYLEFLIVFLKLEIKSFKDLNEIFTQEKRENGGITIIEKKLNHLLVEFKSKVYPLIKETYFRSRCDELFK